MLCLQLFGQIFYLFLVLFILVSYVLYLLLVLQKELLLLILYELELGGKLLVRRKVAVALAFGQASLLC